MGEMADFFLDRIDQMYEYDRPTEYTVITYFDFIRETDKAFLLQLKKDNNKKEWFPKQECNINKKKKTINVPDWLLERKGL